MEEVAGSADGTPSVPVAITACNQWTPQMSPLQVCVYISVGVYICTCVRAFDLAMVLIAAVSLGVCVFLSSSHFHLPSFNPKVFASICRILNFLHAHHGALSTLSFRSLSVLCFLFLSHITFVFLPLLNPVNSLLQT